jgi:cell wall-associated NlpC family hydrolase
MTELDPRLHPLRPDLAGAELEGRAEAPRFVAGHAAQVARGTADLRRAPSPIAPLGSQLLAGESVTVYEVADGWAWVQNQSDGYVGYVEHAALGGEVRATTHWVKALRTFLFPEPDEKAPPLDALPMTARIEVVAERGRFSEVAGGGWITGRHLAPRGAHFEDFVTTALGFMGVPYLWGGKTSLGLDCSGLIQVALAAAGIDCLRDSDMQAETLGEARSSGAAPERGDLIYMPGHSAIALDGWRVVHTNAHDMMTTIEPLADLLARVEKESGQGITAVRRPRPGA